MDRDTCLYVWSLGRHQAAHIVMAGHHDTPHTTTAADNVFSYQFNFQFSKRFRRGLETLECCNETITEAECDRCGRVLARCCVSVLSSAPLHGRKCGRFQFRAGEQNENAAAAALKVFLIGHKLRSVG